MIFLKLLIRIPFPVWILVFLLMGYFDYTSWKQDIYQPLVDGNTAKENEIRVKQKQLAAAEEFKRTKEAKLKELQDLREKLEASQDKLPKSSSIPELLKSLADISDETGLSFSKFVPGASETEKFLHKTSVEVHFAGTYVQIMSFLDATANLTRVVGTKKIELSPIANIQQRGTNPAGFITAVATLETYHLSEGAN